MFIFYANERSDLIHFLVFATFFPPTYPIIDKKLE